MRIGGFALVGLAVVAALVGLLTLATGGSTDQALAPTSSTEGAAPADPNAAPPAVDPNAPPPAVDPNAAPAPSAVVAPPPGAAPAAGTPPPAGAAPPAGVAPPVAAAPAPTDEPIAPFTPNATAPDPGAGLTSARAPLRVYNNSTIKGLAEDAAADFRTAGWQVDSVGNYGSGIIPTSTVYYQPGEEAAAEALAGEFGMRSMPRFNGLESATNGLIVIVTRDYH